MKRTDPETSRAQFRPENLVEMALELAVSLNLPDLVQAVAARLQQIFGSQAVVVGLCHNAHIEPVLLQTTDGVVSERKSLARLTPMLSAAALCSVETIHSVDARSLVTPDLLSELRWKDLLTVRLTGSNGELLGLLLIAGPQPTDKQQILAVARLISTSLENSRLFTQITQASKQWAELFDSLSDFIVLHDEKHHVMRVNRAFADFIGVRPAELIGIHMRELLAKGSNLGMQPCPFCVQIADKEDFHHPALDRFYLLSTSRVHGALNDGLQSIHVLRDITERREAQRRYQQLFDNVQEGVFFSTPEGRFLEVNDALVSMLGYESKDELLAIDIPTQLYVSADERDHSHRNMAPTGEVRNMEIQFRRKDGTLMPALVNASVVRDAAGSIIQYRGMIFDMTEIKRFQTQLQRERDFNLQILNNTQNMILVADTAGLISYANRRCFIAEAYGKSDLVGQRLIDLVENSDRQAWQNGFDLSLQGEQVNNLELQMVLGNSVTGLFSVNLSPMRDASEAVSSVVIVMNDITETSMIQAKLMNTEKLAAVGQLVSGVAHEVNNPLTAIMGFADLMLENPDLPSSAQEDLQVIMHEAERTKEIVQNLLSFARQTPPQRSLLDVNSILRRTIALRSYDLSSHGVDVVEHLAKDLPQSVGDEPQLLQVFLNILNNAYDAVRDTGRKGHIEVFTSVEGDQVRIDFKDNGLGVNNIERIFEPFFTTKPVGKGTGLGLSICYGIVRQHGGEVIAANNVDAPGATFTIKLPHQQPAQKQAAAVGGYAR